MVRRSTPQQHLAEDYFPVRVRVAVPPKGFGAQINTMHGWLNQHIGKDRHWVGADADGGRPDAVLFYSTCATPSPSSTASRAASSSVNTRHDRAISDGSSGARIAVPRPHCTRVVTNTTNEALASSRPTAASAKACLATQTK